MPVLLEGGCRVGLLREGAREDRGKLTTFRHVDRRAGATAISLRVLELAPGGDCALRNTACDEVLYVLEGRGRVRLDGQARDVEPDVAIYLRPGSRLELENPGSAPLVLVSSRCPDPGDEGDAERVAPAAPASSGTLPIVSLSERQSETTADRWYRVLLDERVGSREVTQFVGGIPPGRAPDHFHEYEEVLCILSGRGRLWAGRSNTPIGPGSCVFLPRRQVHCVENSGDGELRLLGVFYPAGSPAVRYEAD
jgi:mannose-6-phosphate isomerase-like protein (cupin superfamily)